MRSIAIYAEVQEGTVSSSAAELVTAAKELDPAAKITVFAVGGAALAQQLCWPGVSALVAESAISPFQEDAMAAEVTALLRRLDPDWVLVPATELSRALFARAAAALDVGMTGDCTRLALEDGVFLQHKPAFGADVMVSCVETARPAMVTVTAGVYAPCAHGAGEGTEVLPGEDRPSGVEVLDTEPRAAESIAGAERVLSLGRGVLDSGAYPLAEQAAEKLSAVIGGTRPLVDSGAIPFERQIGQTGCTVHPRVCLLMGVSGAIQHTEGIRDAKLTIAVNTDPKAAVFSFADYGVTTPAEELLPELLKRLEK